MHDVLRSLSLWFWHLLPANPILVRVVFGASRRVRHLWLRTGYLAALTGIVLGSMFLTITGHHASLAELAKEASQTFKAASIAQLALMCFLAPVFTASAITQERDAQTFNILLSTPLSNAQIVFGSLMSRLYFVLMLLLSGLPIFLMTMVYGGVTTSQVLESFALAGSTAILTGAFAIFVAMLAVGTRRTIFSFYLLIALYLVCIYLLGIWDRTFLPESPPNIANRRMSWLTPFHPFLALDVALNRVYAPAYARLVDRPSLIRYAVAYPSSFYVVWTTLLAFVLTLSAVLFVRRGSRTGEATFWSRIVERIQWRRAGAQTRPPRHVWNNPVAWREAKTRAMGGTSLRWVMIAAGFAGPLVCFWYYRNGQFLASEVPRWLAAIIIVQFALALIIATNTAATSIAKEKETRTLDLLLTTPLTSQYILWGKLRGLVSFALPLLAGPVLVLLLFGGYAAFQTSLRGVVWIETAFEVGALLVIYTAGACVIGLWRSLTSRTNVVAVMHSLAFLILLCGLLTMIGIGFVSASGGEAGAFLSPFTPFTAIWYLIHPADLFGSHREFLESATAARHAALVGSVLAGALYAFIVWRAYAALVRNFDMTLRKQSGT
jgi:ABC-type transport system involved in multi-copper enzyme maturation permease subunit